MPTFVRVQPALAPDPRPTAAHPGPGPGLRRRRDSGLGLRPVAVPAGAPGASAWSPSWSRWPTLVITLEFGSLIALRNEVVGMAFERTKIFDQDGCGLTERVGRGIIAPTVITGSS